MKDIIAKQAIQLTIMDAIENGHCDKNELIEYMKSETFQSSAIKYKEMLQAEFIE